MSDILKKLSGEAVLFDMDCSLYLSSDETITGTPTMSYLPTGLSGTAILNFASASVNTVAISYPDGITAAIGKAIQVRISGGAPTTQISPRTYTVMATFTTTRGDTRIARGLLQVVPN